METNWSRTYAYRAPTLVRPASLAELSAVVAGSAKIGVLGTRHAFNDLADTSGVLVSLDRLPGDVEIDSATSTARVSGHLRYGDIVHRLDAAGFALPNLASLPHISVAGACATATHGSGDANGTLATSVVAMDLVLADGRPVTVHAGDDDFAGAVVHLGALGVVTHLTLELIPRFDMVQVVYDDLAWDVAVENLDAVTSAAHSVSLFTDLTRPSFNVWLKSRDPRPDGDFFGAKAATEPRHPLAWGTARNATEQLGVPGPWYARLPHFRLEFTPSSGEEIQSEYLVPRSQAAGALTTLAELAPLLAPLVQVCEIRTVAADDLWLSPAYAADVVAVHFTWYDRPEDIAVVMPRLEERLLEHHARPHWGKVFTVPAERLAASYPRLADFRELADRMDPERTFANEYLQRTILFG
jgi:xylitol oxidase